MTAASPSIFAQACDPTYHPSVWQAWASAITAEQLRIGGARLVFNVPPRHGKSRLFAVETPLWTMLHTPGTEVVVASYAMDLAERHSREARERIENDIFQHITPARLKEAHAGVSDWGLTNGSSFKAVGVGGSLTGHGADLLILDDLHKDAAEANSPTMRARTWDWLQSVAMTRLSPRASAILIGTRWHQDDVTGRLLAREHARWTQINLAALAGERDELDRRPGEALWPERFPAEALTEIRNTVSPYFWAALYDGNPVSDTGNHVNIDLFHQVDPSEVPAGLRCVRYWDLAVTKNTANDFTSGALCGVDADKNLWILDVRRGRWEWTEARSVICARAIEDRCQVGIEGVGIGKGLIQNLRETFPAEFVLTETTPERDKLTRALPWFQRVNGGKCFLVRGPWNTEFFAECQAFPLGRNDDQVDAISGADDLLFGHQADSPLELEGNKVSQVIHSRRERSVLL